jgi:hypothetical protein
MFNISWILDFATWIIYSGLYKYLSAYISIPVAATWSIGHLWNALFHFSLLILDIWQDSLDRGSAQREATTYTAQH